MTNRGQSNLYHKTEKMILALQISALPQRKVRVSIMNKKSLRATWLNWRVRRDFRNVKKKKKKKKKKMKKKKKKKMKKKKKKKKK